MKREDESHGTSGPGARRRRRCRAAAIGGRPVESCLALILGLLLLACGHPDGEGALPGAGKPGRAEDAGISEKGPAAGEPGRVPDPGGPEKGPTAGQPGGAPAGGKPGEVPDSGEPEKAAGAGQAKSAPAASTGEGAPPAGARTTDQLAAIGYLSGYETAPEGSGVTRHDPSRAWPGLNLYNSGHDQSAMIVDMEGRLLHRWRYDVERVLPIDQEADDQESRKELFWRRVHLYPNGDLLAVCTGRGLIRLDRRSRLLWVVPGRFHHDVDVDAEGRIYALEWRWSRLPLVNREQDVREDWVVVIDPRGRVLRRFSLFRAFAISRFAPLLDFLPGEGHIMHTNTLQVFDGRYAGRSPLFRKGRALVSLRSISVVAIIDLRAERVVWALTGQWRAQHDPALLPGGRMLLFDNRGHHGRSQVLEFDPFTQQVLWAYEGSEENGFFSRNLGACQRLPNGNTLITESEAGRAFEVTPEREIVWEFFNPARAGHDSRFIATLLQVERLRPSFFGPWLAEGSSGGGDTGR